MNSQISHGQMNSDLNPNKPAAFIPGKGSSGQIIPIREPPAKNSYPRKTDGKNKWTSKESLIVLSFILICIFSIMQFIFNQVWSTSILAFRLLSGVIFTIFLIIAIVGLRFLILDRKRIWAQEREGLILFIIGSAITVVLPIIGASVGQIPETFFASNLWALVFGTILIIIGAVIIAWFGGFFSIWFFGLVYYIVMSSHEAFLIDIYTHHYGPYDQYYGLIGVFLIVVSAILLLYHELKFLYLGKLIKRANDHRQNGRYNEANELLKRAIKIYPRYASAWNNKGNVMFNLGRYDDAIKCYNKALASSPEYEIAKRNKILALQKKTGATTVN